MFPAGSVAVALMRETEPEVLSLTLKVTVPPGPVLIFFAPR